MADNLTATYTIENFAIYSGWTNAGGRITSGPSTGRATKTVEVELPSEAIITSATLNVTCGATVGGAAILSAGGVTLQANQSNSVDFSNLITDSGAYDIEFVFKDNGNPNLSAGDHGIRMQFSAISFVIVYSDTPPAPEPGPVIDHIANTKIAVFSPHANNFSGNGLVTLTPLSCIVSETAGGSYELELTHELDEYGKWQYLIEDYLIRSPVPETRTPKITIPAASYWKVKTSVTTTPLYGTLPYYTRTKSSVDTIRDNPSQYSWSSSKHYSAGDYVVYGNAIYRARIDNTDMRPNYDGTWTWVASLYSDGSGGDEGQTIYHEGTVAENIPGGEIVAFVANYNGTYFRARSLRGIVGYIRRSDCEQASSSGGGAVIDPRIITEQLFRIYQVEINTAQNTVTARARHKSYDYAGNAIMDCKVVEADPTTAIAIMQGSLVNQDTRLIVCNVTNKRITKDWSWQNPVYALLDPDEGILPEMRGRLIRDNDDFFVLSNATSRTGITLSYGVNLLGVTWNRSTEEVITRVVPRGKAKDGSDLFLGELYIDSAVVNEYPVIRTEILDCDCQVGQEEEHADGTKQTLTEEDCITRMRKAAQDRFDVDKVDSIVVKLEVEFLLLGDTEEYSQYKGLQKVRLYDAIRINHGPIGLDTTVQVSGYEWDALTERFIKITLGDVFSYGGRTVTGYNMSDGAITYQKLSPGLVKRIKSNE